MSTVFLNDGPHYDIFPGSMQALVPRPLPSHSDPLTKKRVCFYKSGDPQFLGHRMVITSRTFKSFDALLDALSKKVPLPFGVRNITTPKGTHAVRTLDDVQDGGSYLCSDQRKVKPLNLDEVHKRQVPWNTTRPLSAGRQARREVVRQLAKRSEVTTRTVKMADTFVVVRTPKRLTVFRNRDPSLKRVIVLDKRIAPNFEALLDYLSQVMQFPVVKLYTEDGRRVDGLPALILCSGIVVAAGNEHFKMGNFSVHSPLKFLHSSINEPMGPAETEIQLQKVKKTVGTFSRTRNFSLSSERYLAEQIHKSLNENQLEHNREKFESVDVSQNGGSEEMETCKYVAGFEERNCPIMPTEDDIEKSFRVNEDGSMTVEMKVHLTMNQEETIHWTTTLSRTFVNTQQRAACISKPASGSNSLDITNDSGKDSNGPHSLDYKEMNNLTTKSSAFIKEGIENQSDVSEKLKPIFRRLPTPGPRMQRTESSVKDVKRDSENEIQECSAYSYMERTAQGELTEGYCVVSRSSSSSTRTLSKSRKSESGEAFQTSVLASSASEVLQLQNNGIVGKPETVMHIYESQNIQDNFYANTQWDVNDNVEYQRKASPQSRPNSESQSPDNFIVDSTRKFTCSHNAEKTDMLFLSSACSAQINKKHNLSNSENTENGDLIERLTQSIETNMNNTTAMTKDAKEANINGNRKKTTLKSKKSKKSSSSELSSKLKGSSQGSSHEPPTVNSSNVVSQNESEKIISSSAESHKHSEKEKKTKSKNSAKDKNLNLNVRDQKKSEKELKRPNRTTTQNVNKKDYQKLCVKKNISVNRSAPHAAPLIKTKPKQRSLNGHRPQLPNQQQELSESLSLPVIQSTVNQYVENWLQKIQPESVPYEDEVEGPENKQRALFQIGSDSSNTSVMKSEPEKDEDSSLEENSSEWPVSYPPVKITCEGEPVDQTAGSASQRNIGYCKSMPTLGIQAPEQQSHLRMNKSFENLVPPDVCNEKETPRGLEVKVRSGIKPVLKQLCLSVQSIRRAISQTPLQFLEKDKSSSLPEFQSHVASAFCSPSRAFLSFLSLMTLKDGLSIHYKDESQTNNSGLCPEALHVMQSLEKISQIKDENELKASLTSLRSSTSSQLKQSWKDFQEKNVFDESPPLSPRFSEQDFAVEVESVDDGLEREKQREFNIERLLDELNMPEELHREISSLVEGELQTFKHVESNRAFETSQTSSKAKELDESSVNGSLVKAADMEEEQDSDIAPNALEPQDLLRPHSSDSDAVENEHCMEALEPVVSSPEEHAAGSSTEEVSRPTETNQSITGNINEQIVSEQSESENSFSEENPSESEPDRKVEDAYKFSEDQDSVSKPESICSPINIKEGVNYDEEMGIVQRSEPELDQHVGVKQSFSESEPDCVQFESREAELNDNQEKEKFCSDGLQEEDDLREETDHSRSVENVTDEEPHKEESMSVSSKTPSHHSDSESERQQTIEAENEVPMSPDEANKDQDDNGGNSSPESGSKNKSSEISERSHLDPKQGSLTISDRETEVNSSLSESSRSGSLISKNNCTAGEHMEEIDGSLASGHSADAVGQDCIASTENNKANVPTESGHSLRTSVKLIDEPMYLGLEHGYQYLPSPNEISQELLDLINSALLSSTLTVTYDSYGNLKLEPDISKPWTTFAISTRSDNHYGHKRLPSPNTSDLSDYRPETSEMCGYQSPEMFSESEEDEAERLRIFREIIKQSSEKPTGANHTQENGSVQSSKKSAGKQTHSSKSFKSNKSPTSSKSLNKEPLDEAAKTQKSLAVKGDNDSNEGVLIDKGRWLLKENHLIRNSPPESTGLYGNEDTTSGDTTQDNRSEDSPYTNFQKQTSALAEISSSELEDMAKPSEPLRSYFNMSHSSDSDPLLDAHSISGGDTKWNKKLKILPVGEPSNVWAKKNSSQSSFASVEFKVSDGKVHPQDGPGPGANKSRAVDVSEEETNDGLNLRCGQHCPIL